MIKDIQIIADCEKCQKRMNLDIECNAYCDDCSYQWIETDDVESAIADAACNDYLWTDKRGYEGFKNEEEKEMFMKGIKFGYSSALFWISDYFGLIEFFEHHIGHNMENLKKDEK